MSVKALAPEDAASQIISALMQAREPGEWSSVSLNITIGVEEGPVVLAAILPGTTERHAKKIQDRFISEAQKMNNKQ